MHGRRATVTTGLALLASRRAHTGPPPPTLIRGVLRIGTYFVNPPFEFLKNGKEVGYDIDLMNEVALRLYLRPLYVNTRWETILREMQEHRYDCTSVGSPLRQPVNGRSPGPSRI